MRTTVFGRRQKTSSREWVAHSIFFCIVERVLLSTQQKRNWHRHASLSFFLSETRKGSREYESILIDWDFSWPESCLLPSSTSFLNSSIYKETRSGETTSVNDASLRARRTSIYLRSSRLNFAFLQAFPSLRNDCLLMGTCPRNNGEKLKSSTKKSKPTVRVHQNSRSMSAANSRRRKEKEDWSLFIVKSLREKCSMISSIYLRWIFFHFDLHRLGRSSDGSKQDHRECPRLSHARKIDWPHRWRNCDQVYQEYPSVRVGRCNHRRLDRNVEMLREFLLGWIFWSMNQPLLQQTLRNQLDLNRNQTIKLTRSYLHLDMKHTTSWKDIFREHSRWFEQLLYGLSRSRRTFAVLDNPWLWYREPTVLFAIPWQKYHRFDPYQTGQRLVEVL